MDTLVARGLRAQLKTGSLISGARLIALDFYPDAPPATMGWSHTPPQLPTHPGSLESIEASVVRIIKKLDQVPYGEIGTNLNKSIVNLDKTLAGAQGTFTNADQLLRHASQLIAPNSVLDAQLSKMLQDVGGAAQAMRLLADYLERHPEALIRGKAGEAK
jgi:paraquat-inducible protein B